MYGGTTFVIDPIVGETTVVCCTGGAAAVVGNSPSVSIASSTISRKDGLVFADELGVGVDVIETNGELSSWWNVAAETQKVPFLPGKTSSVSGPETRFRSAKHKFRQSAD